MNKQRLRAIALAVLAWVSGFGLMQWRYAATAYAQQPIPGATADVGYQWPTPSAADWALIKGALDIHVHLDPDSAGSHSHQGERLLDVIEMAKQAKAAGMRGFVIKQHYDQSAQLAYLTRQQVPGIEVYGGVGQNLTVGGVNAAAVYHMAEVKGGLGRIVWLPTWDSENQVEFDIKERGAAERPFTKVSDNGVLTPATLQVLEAVKTTRTRDSNAELLLETGHISADEVLLVVAAAQKLGLKHVVVTHGFGEPVFMTVPQLQQAVEMGAMIEFVAAYSMGAEPLFSPAAYADAIRKVGVDNVIISSDFGQVGRPSPPQALALFAGQMRQQGFTATELHTMLAVNPAKALGLPLQE